MKMMNVLWCFGADVLYSCIYVDPSGEKQLVQIGIDISRLRSLCIFIFLYVYASKDFFKGFKEKFVSSTILDILYIFAY